MADRFDVMAQEICTPIMMEKEARRLRRFVEAYEIQHICCYCGPITKALRDVASEMADAIRATIPPTTEEKE